MASMEYLKRSGSVTCMVDGQLIVEYESNPITSDDDQLYCFGTRDVSDDWSEIRSFLDEHGVGDCDLVEWNGDCWENIDTGDLYNGKEIIEVTYEIPAEWAVEQF